MLKLPNNLSRGVTSCRLAVCAVFERRVELEKDQITSEELHHIMRIFRSFVLLLVVVLVTPVYASKFTQAEEIDEALPVEQPQEEQPKDVQGPSLTWTKLFKEYTDADYRMNVYSEYAYGNGITVSSDGLTSKDAIHWTRNPANILFKDV